jgi:hypothetical protein
MRGFTNTLESKEVWDVRTIYDKSYFSGIELIRR